MKIKAFLSFNVQIETSQGKQVSIRNLVNVTWAVPAWYAMRNTYHDIRDQLGAAAGAAFGLNKCVWGMG